MSRVTDPHSRDDVALTHTVVTTWCQVRGDVTSYEVRYTPKLLGRYLAQITLRERPIQGSPLLFEALAGMPDTKTSRFVLPEAPLFAQVRE